jgi:hypothetical protein
MAPAGEKSVASLTGVGGPPPRACGVPDGPSPSTAARTARPATTAITTIAAATSARTVRGTTN